MKNLLKIILINMLVFSALAFVVTSITLDEKCGGSVPDLGHAFRGYAKYSGSALGSKVVTATLDGVDFSDTTDSNGWYELDVSRCGNSSATEITFTVCTRSSRTATFEEGAINLSTNLTASSACPTTPAPPGGGGGGTSGGGGGAGGAAPSAETNLDLKTDFTTTIGVTLKQTQGDTATFTLGGVEYTVEVTKLMDDSVTLTVGDQSKTLNIGDTVYFDVNGDGVDDISVTLKGIDGGRAELVYKKLDSGMLALLDMIRDFYAGTSPYAMMEILDKIRAFYGG